MSLPPNAVPSFVNKGMTESIKLSEVIMTKPRVWEGDKNVLRSMFFINLHQFERFHALSGCCKHFMYPTDEEFMQAHTQEVCDKLSNYHFARVNFILATDNPDKEIFIWIRDNCGHAIGPEANDYGINNAVRQAQQIIISEILNYLTIDKINP